MRKSLILHTLLLAGNFCVFLGMSGGQVAMVNQKCADYGDNPPGVTVYLETSPAEAKPADVQQPTRQWTAVSFKEAGVAPDGSKQAMMSIHQTDMKKEAVDSPPAQPPPRWQ